MKKIQFLQAFIILRGIADVNNELKIMYKVFCQLAKLNENISADEQLTKLIDQYHKNEKILFQFIDLTGRGIKSKITLNQILDEEDEQDDYDNWLHEWAKESEEGDEWKDITRRYIKL